jgi:hypothetical protein
MKPTQTDVRRMTEWETEAENAAQLPAVRLPRDNFVAPLRPPVSSTFAGLQPAQPHELQPAQSVGQIVTMATSHVDRAQGFRIETMSLAAVIGGLSVIVALVGFRVPLFSLAILGWFGTGFGLVWIIAYFFNKVTSPDSAMLMQIFGSYRLTRNNQKFTQEYLRHIHGMPTPQERKAQRNAQKGRR